MADPFEALQRELIPGERVLWKGTPGRFRLRGQDVFLGIFVLVWLGMAVAANFGTRSNPNRDADDVPIATFMLIMGFVFFTFIFVTRIRAHRSWAFAVTDRRVIALRSGWVRFVRATFVGNLPSITQTIRRDGSGSLTFGSAPFWGSASSLAPEFGFLGGQAPSFFDLEDPRTPLDIVNRLRSETNSRPGRAPTAA